MELELERIKHSKYGINGVLMCKGKVICHTCEHPSCFLPEETYTITMKHNKKEHRLMPSLDGKAWILMGNGAMACRDGSVVVGERYLPGVVLHSRQQFALLYERIAKNIKRGNEVTLVIR